MTRVQRVFISIVGLVAVIVMSMNAVLLITHPDLTYGPGIMYHVSVNFIIIALIILYFLAKYFHPRLNDDTNDNQTPLDLIFKHDVILLTIISSIVLIIYFFTIQLNPSISTHYIFGALILITFIWMLITLKAHTKKIRNNHLLLLNFGSSIIFSSITIYLCIELFLYVNLS